MTDLSGLNPFAFNNRNPSVSGTRWGAGSADRLPTSGEMFRAESAFQANIYRPQFLPLFGPQVPSINVGYTTNEIPGSVYDSGVPGNGAFTTQFAGNAARTVNDFMVQPYTYQRGDDLVPLSLKLKQWWAGIADKVSNPFSGSAGTVDTATAGNSTAGVLKIGALAVVGVGAAVAAVAIFKK